MWYLKSGNCFHFWQKKQNILKILRLSLLTNPNFVKFFRLSPDIYYMIYHGMTRYCVFKSRHIWITSFLYDCLSLATLPLYWKLSIHPPSSKFWETLCVILSNKKQRKEEGLSTLGCRGGILVARNTLKFSGRGIVNFQIFLTWVH